MKLYHDPVATTCRPILMFVAEHHMPVEMAHVDLMAGEHRSAAFAAINPNCAVPVLVDGTFVLTECSAILKYLADTVGSPTYPADRQARARINAVMDWFNTGLYRELGYGLVYPTVLRGQYGYVDDVTQAAVLTRATAGVERWLGILDRHMLGGEPYVCGSAPSIADYLGASYVSAGNWIGLDLSPWPNVKDWIARMRARPGSRDVFAAYDAWVAGLPRAKAA